MGELGKIKGDRPCVHAPIRCLKCGAVYQTEVCGCERRIAPLILAIDALGGMPDGWCRCSKDRDGSKKTHEPECAGVRRALDDAR